MENNIGAVRRTGNKNKRGWVELIALICAAVLILMPFVQFLPIHGEERIYGDVIRLHILANSDSEGDQEIKLALRDLILADIAEITAGCRDIDRAKAEVEKNLALIEERAALYLAGINGGGRETEVTAALVEEYYPTREYTGESGDFALPAGNYTSLKLTVGAGAGQNWWCVLFPPLCLSGSKIEEDLAVAGYTNEQIGILKKDKSGKYTIRFKFLEFFGKLFS